MGKGVGVHKVLAVGAGIVGIAIRVGTYHHFLGNLFGLATDGRFQLGSHFGIFTQPDFGIFTPLPDAYRIIAEP